MTQSSDTRVPAAQRVLFSMTANEFSPFFDNTRPVTQREPVFQIGRLAPDAGRW
jgi:hypothetical protein